MAAGLVVAAGAVARGVGSAVVKDSRNSFHVNNNSGWNVTLLRG